MNEEFDVENIRKRMYGALESVKNDFKSLRTGRASSSILDNITVEVYGSKMPISQCATINVPEPRLITVNVWDKENISAIEKSIQNSGLGINPVIEGNLLRLPLPELNEERRKEISKLAAQFAEHARVSVRNVRKDGMDKIKKFRSEGMSEDESQVWSDEIQALTDKMTLSIENLQKEKQSEIVKF